MTIFCDTSVLVAACVRRHPHFPRARPVLADISRGTAGVTGVTSAHSVAELYSALTMLPVEPRILPSEAASLIDANVIPFFELVPITAAMYQRAVAACVQHGFAGGKVNDAVLIECARSAWCDRIYTFNSTDFERLAPDLQRVIAAP